MGRLVKVEGCPPFNPRDMWMVESSASHFEFPREPNVCQMPDAAKKMSMGAKMQPRYKCRVRSFCMGAGFFKRLAAGRQGSQAADLSQGVT
jgi:hypothetical protein